MSRGNLLTPYPHFGNFALSERWGYSWFDSFPGRSGKRFPDGHGAFGRTTGTQARNGTFQFAWKLEF